MELETMWKLLGLEIWIFTRNQEIFILIKCNCSN